MPLREVPLVPYPAPTHTPQLPGTGIGSSGTHGRCKRGVEGFSVGSKKDAVDVSVAEVPPYALCPMPYALCICRSALCIC
eukprot:1437419-Rhodomonas_salina.1